MYVKKSEREHSELRNKNILLYTYIHIFAIE